MKKPITSLLAAGILSAASAQAADLSIEITNLTNGIYFTPLLIAAHDNNNQLFELGTAASSHLQAMAEGGDTSGLATDLMAVSANIVDDPVGGLLAPGTDVTATLTTDTANTQLSLVAMLLPTNDGFVGLNSLTLPNASGTYTYYLNAYDAGTEANDEIVNGGGTPNTAGIPADPGGHNGSNGSGVTDTENNTHVHIHRGNLGDTNDSGGSSDLDSRVHRWLNPVARLVITVN